MTTEPTTIDVDDLRCAAWGADDIANESDLATAIDDALADAAEVSGVRINVRTFADAGIMTTNAGLVVRVGGREYQVSIVRSR